MLIRSNARTLPAHGVLDIKVVIQRFFVQMSHIDTSRICICHRTSTVTCNWRQSLNLPALWVLLTPSLQHNQWWVYTTYRLMFCFITTTYPDSLTYILKHMSLSFTAMIKKCLPLARRVGNRSSTPVQILWNTLTLIYLSFYFLLNSVLSIILKIRWIFQFSVSCFKCLFVQVLDKLCEVQFM